MRFLVKGSFGPPIFTRLIPHVARYDLDISTASTIEIANDGGFIHQSLSTRTSAKIVHFIAADVSNPIIDMYVSEIYYLVVGRSNGETNCFEVMRTDDSCERAQYLRVNCINKMYSILSSSIRIIYTIYM